MSNAYGIRTSVGDEGEFRSVAGDEASVFSDPGCGWAHMLVGGACLPASYMTDPMVDSLRALAGFLSDGMTRDFEVDGESDGLWGIRIGDGTLSVREFVDGDVIREQAFGFEDAANMVAGILRDLARDASGWISWECIGPACSDETIGDDIALFDRHREELLGAVRAAGDAVSGNGAISSSCKDGVAAAARSASEVIAETDYWNAF